MKLRPEQRTLGSVANHCSLDQVQIMIDRAGNTRNRAKRVTLSSTPKSFRDLVGSSDTSDFFSFRLDKSSNFKLALKNLTAEANVTLLDAAGKVLQRSTRKPKSRKQIERSLDPGEYFVRVFSKNREVNTSYRLTLSTSDTATNPNSNTGTNTSSSQKPFNIQFDYRFDNGWFTPERKAALEAAADIWETIIQDEFADTPIGTSTPIISNPGTGEVIGEFITDRTIDDVLIFAGARELSFTTLALGGPSGDPVNQPRYTGTDFEPWLGSIAFDSSTNWFFDSTPTTPEDIPPDSFDFISAAAHEIGHVLGFLNGPAGVSTFVSQTSSSGFSGINARSLNGGNAIPLEFSGSSHILSGYQFGTSGEPLMSPRVNPGQRKLPTVLDLAILDDLGYTVDYSKAAQNLISREGTTSRRSTSNSAIYGTCGCATCLMS